MNDEIGKRIKMVRESLGLTQKEFGKRIGIAQNNMPAIEKGDRKVGRRIVLDIESEFSVNLKWLGTGEGEMFLKNQKKKGAPILPMQYVAGGATDFINSEDFDKYEMFTPPLNNIHLMIPMANDSMDPLLHRGDLLLSRISDVNSFHPGKIYALDTADGMLVGKLFSTEDPEVVELTYLNKLYSSYKLKRNEVLSIYSVVAFLHNF